MERALDAAGLRLQARVLAEGDALPVILFHATSFCAEVWRPVWQASRAAGAAAHLALAVDVRGHGRSDAPDTPASYAWGRLVEDALAWAGEVGGARGSLLVGHSSGATASLVAAARRPDLVRAVVAVEPVLFDAPAGDEADSFAGSRAMAARARKRRAVFADRDEARAFLAARFPYSGFAPASLDAFLEGGLAAAGDGGVALRCRPEVEAACYDGAAALDLRELDRGLRVPVLVLAAEHSGIPPAQLARLQHAARRHEVVRVPRSTHFAALEQPEAVGRAIAGFCAEHAGARA